MKDVDFPICNEVDGMGMRYLMTMIGDKWSIFLIVALEKSQNGRDRYSELERKIPGISQKMLTATLKKTGS